LGCTDDGVVAGSCKGRRRVMTHAVVSPDGGIESLDPWPNLAATTHNISALGGVGGGEVMRVWSGMVKERKKRFRVT
jgi:hypothetical protein